MKTQIQRLAVTHLQTVPRDQSWHLQILSADVETNTMSLSMQLAPLPLFLTNYEMHIKYNIKANNTGKHNS